MVLVSSFRPGLRGGGAPRCSPHHESSVSGPHQRPPSTACLQAGDPCSGLPSWMGTATRAPEGTIPALPRNLLGGGPSHGSGRCGQAAWARTPIVPSPAASCATSGTSTSLPRRPLRENEDRGASSWRGGREGPASPGLLQRERRLPALGRRAQERPTQRRLELRKADLPQEESFTRERCPPGSEPAWPSKPDPCVPACARRSRVRPLHVKSQNQKRLRSFRIPRGDSVCQARPGRVFSPLSLLTWASLTESSPVIFFWGVIARGVRSRQGPWLRIQQRPTFCHFHSPPVPVPSGGLGAVRKPSYPRCSSTIGTPILLGGTPPFPLMPFRSEVTVILASSEKPGHKNQEKPPAVDTGSCLPNGCCSRLR